jgi:hypothetical protein
MMPHRFTTTADPRRSKSTHSERGTAIVRVVHELVDTLDRFIRHCVDESNHAVIR